VVVLLLLLLLLLLLVVRARRTSQSRPLRLQARAMARWQRLRPPRNLNR
jgi:hypothetical protein